MSEEEKEFMQEPSLALTPKITGENAKKVREHLKNPPKNSEFLQECVEIYEGIADNKLNQKEEIEKLKERIAEKLLNKENVKISKEEIAEIIELASDKI